jgi:Domain of unknown function (DUF362)
MSRRSTVITRRDFVRVGGGLAAVGLLGGGRRDGEGQEPPARSRVVLIRRKESLGEDNAPDGRVIHEMLNEAVTALLETPGPADAWKRLIRPADVVGIKTNVWRNLATPPVLEEAIRAEVIGAGVAAGDVAVDDRGVLDNPVFKRATAFINTRPMRTHHWAGLGTCLKNMIMFVPRPPDYHGDACASLGAIWRLPELEGKVRLNILVMLTPQFHGVGPHSFSPEFVWPYKGLIVGTDPVAVDATGARIIEAKRREHFGEERPISPPPHHIQIADTRYGLGVSDPQRIDLIRLGWSEGALI